MSLIRWANAGPPETQLRQWTEDLLKMKPVGIFSAGGTTTLDDDQQVIRQISQVGREAGVVIFVNAWEPPIAEFTDHLKDLRANLGECRPILVVPVAEETTEAPSDISLSHLEMWRQKIRTMGDPWLSVQRLSGGQP